MLKTISKTPYLKSILIFALVIMYSVMTMIFEGQQGNVYADNKGTESPSFPLFQKGKEGDSSEYEEYKRVISTLLIVIALIIATVYVLKKKYGVRTNIRGKRRLIQIVDHTPMGVKKSVSLVKVPGKHLLLGLTNDRIELITEIANEDIADDSEPVNKKEFLNLVKKSIAERKQR